MTDALVLLLVGALIAAVSRCVCLILVPHRIWCLLLLVPTVLTKSLSWDNPCLSLVTALLPRVSLPCIPVSLILALANLPCRASHLVLSL